MFSVNSKIYNLVIVVLIFGLKYIYNNFKINFCTNYQFSFATYYKNSNILAN